MIRWYLLSIVILISAFQACGKFESLDSDFADFSSVHGHSDTTKVEKVTNSQPTIGNRDFTARVFNQIFSPPNDLTLTTSEANTLKTIQNFIQNNVKRRAEAFGKPCYMLDGIKASDCSPIFANYTNTSGFYGNYRDREEITVQANANITRESLRTKTCDRMVHYNSALLWGLTNAIRVKTKNNTYVASSFPAINQANVEAVTEIFYLRHPSSVDIAKPLIQLGQKVEQDKNLTEAWRAVFLAVCHSPGWQAY